MGLLRNSFDYIFVNCTIKNCLCVVLLSIGILGNGTWLVFLPLAPMKTSSAALLILAFITAMLSITCLLLLGHLLGFHFYLCESQSSRRGIL